MDDPPHMVRRPFGRTGLTTTALGLGMAALGRPGYITLGHSTDFGVDHDRGAVERRAHAVLDEALRLGVGHLDAARSYGDAEPILAAWLAARGIPPGALTVSSKWGYTYTAGWSTDAAVHEVKDHSEPALARQFPESWALLGPWLGVYQVHSATAESGVLADDAVLDTLARLRDEHGLVIGLSTSGPGQGATIRRALGIVRGGAPLFGVVQATWNVLETSAGPALQAAHDAGVGVIVKEALANGRLSGRDRALDGGVADTLMRAVPGAATLDRAALAVAMAQPFADVVLSGAVTADQLRSNAGAVPLAGGADPVMVRECAEAPGAYWARRSELAWT